MEKHNLNEMIGGWFIGNFEPSLLKTDNVEVAVKNYNAGDAVYLSKNDNQIGKFEGLAFKQALFSIWLGDIPAQESLKDEMLGK